MEFAAAGDISTTKSTYQSTLHTHQQCLKAVGATTAYVKAPIRYSFGAKMSAATESG
ncbi:hypothetical protein ACWEWX_51655 [Streptomyces asiaticus]